LPITSAIAPDVLVGAGGCVVATEAAVGAKVLVGATDVAGGKVALAITAVGVCVVIIALFSHPAITAPTAAAVLNLRNPRLDNFFPFIFTIISTFLTSLIILLILYQPD